MAAANRKNPSQGLEDLPLHLHSVPALLRPVGRGQVTGPV